MTTIKSTDPDIRASLAALRRAGRRARQLAAKTNTPIYVLQNGRIVKEWPGRKKAGARSRRSG